MSVNLINHTPPPHIQTRSWRLVIGVGCGLLAGSAFLFLITRQKRSGYSIGANSERDSSIHEALGPICPFATLATPLQQTKTTSAPIKGMASFACDETEAAARGIAPTDKDYVSVPDIHASSENRANTSGPDVTTGSGVIFGVSNTVTADVVEVPFRGHTTSLHGPGPSTTSTQSCRPPNRDTASVPSSPPLPLSPISGNSRPNSGGGNSRQRFLDQQQRQQRPTSSSSMSSSSMFSLGTSPALSSATPSSSTGPSTPASTPSFGPNSPASPSSVLKNASHLLHKDSYNKSNQDGFSEAVTAHNRRKYAMLKEKHRRIVDNHGDSCSTVYHPPKTVTAVPNTPHLSSASAPSTTTTATTTILEKQRTLADTHKKPSHGAKKYVAGAAASSSSSYDSELDENDVGISIKGKSEQSEACAAQDALAAKEVQQRLDTLSHQLQNIHANAFLVASPSPPPSHGQPSQASNPTSPSHGDDSIKIQMTEKDAPIVASGTESTQSDGAGAHTTIARTAATTTDVSATPAAAMMAIDEDLESRLSASVSSLYSYYSSSSLCASSPLSFSNATTTATVSSRGHFGRDRDRDRDEDDGEGSSPMSSRLMIRTAGGGGRTASLSARSRHSSGAFDPQATSSSSSWMQLPSTQQPSPLAQSAGSAVTNGVFPTTTAAGAGARGQHRHVSLSAVAARQPLFMHRTTGFITTRNNMFFYYSLLLPDLVAFARRRQSVDDDDDGEEGKGNTSQSPSSAFIGKFKKTRYRDRVVLAVNPLDKLPLQASLLRQFIKTIVQRQVQRARTEDAVYRLKLAAYEKECRRRRGVGGSVVAMSARLSAPPAPPPPEPLFEWCEDVILATKMIDPQTTRRLFRGHPRCVALSIAAALQNDYPDTDAPTTSSTTTATSSKPRALQNIVVPRHTPLLRIPLACCLSPALAFGISLHEPAPASSVTRGGNEVKSRDNLCDGDSTTSLRQTMSARIRRHLLESQLRKQSNTDHTITTPEAPPNSAIPEEAAVFSATVDGGRYAIDASMAALIVLVVSKVSESAIIHHNHYTVGGTSAGGDKTATSSACTSLSASHCGEMLTQSLDGSRTACPSSLPQQPLPSSTGSSDSASSPLGGGPGGLQRETQRVLRRMATIAADVPALFQPQQHIGTSSLSCTSNTPYTPLVDRYSLDDTTTYLQHHYATLAATRTTTTSSSSTKRHQHDPPVAMYPPLPAEAPVLLPLLLPALAAMDAIYTEEATNTDTDTMAGSTTANATTTAATASGCDRGESLIPSPRGMTRDRDERSAVDGFATEQRRRHVVAADVSVSLLSSVLLPFPAGESEAAGGAKDRSSSSPLSGRGDATNVAAAAAAAAAVAAYQPHCTILSSLLALLMHHEQADARAAMMATGPPPVPSLGDGHQKEEEEEEDTGWSSSSRSFCKDLVAQAYQCTVSPWWPLLAQEQQRQQQDGASDGSFIGESEDIRGLAFPVVLQWAQRERQQQSADKNAAPLGGAWCPPCENNESSAFVAAAMAVDAFGSNQEAAQLLLQGHGDEENDPTPTAASRTSRSPLRVSSPLSLPLVYYTHSAGGSSVDVVAGSDGRKDADNRPLSDRPLSTSSSHCGAPDAPTALAVGRAAVGVLRAREVVLERLYRFVIARSIIEALRDAAETCSTTPCCDGAAAGERDVSENTAAPSRAVEPSRRTDAHVVALMPDLTDILLRAKVNDVKVGAHNGAFKSGTRKPIRGGKKSGDLSTSSSSSPSSSSCSDLDEDFFAAHGASEGTSLVGGSMTSLPTTSGVGGGTSHPSLSWAAAAPPQPPLEQGLVDGGSISTDPTTSGGVKPTTTTHKRRLTDDAVTRLCAELPYPPEVARLMRVAAYLAHSASALVPVSSSVVAASTMATMGTSGGRSAETPTSGGGAAIAAQRACATSSSSPNLLVLAPALSCIDHPYSSLFEADGGGSGGGGGAPFSASTATTTNAVNDYVDRPVLRRRTDANLLCKVRSIAAAGPVQQDPPPSQQQRGNSGSNNNSSHGQGNQAGRRGLRGAFIEVVAGRDLAKTEFLARDYYCHPSPPPQHAPSDKRGDANDGDRCGTAKSSGGNGISMASLYAQRKACFEHDFRWLVDHGYGPRRVTPDVLFQRDRADTPLLHAPHDPHDEDTAHGPKQSLETTRDIFAAPTGTARGRTPTTSLLGADAHIVLSRRRLVTPSSTVGSPTTMIARDGGGGGASPSPGSRSRNRRASRRAKKI